MQGQSGYTEWKERGIAAGGVAPTAKIFNAKIKQKGYSFPFWMFDFFSGSGHNVEAGCLGSPPAMLRVVRELGLNYRLHCFDRDEDACAALIVHPEIEPEYNERIFVHHGDNAECALLALELVRQRRDKPDMAMGIWLCDPNDANINLTLLRDMGRFFPRMDAVLNIAGTAIKRANGAGGSRASLAEMIELCNKDYWLIREPVGKWDWTLVIGRNNVDVGEYRSMGFHKLESPKGQEILKFVTLTREQLRLEARNANLSIL